MALFKVFRGKSTALDSVKKVDGHAYFCTDDGSFWIDYKEDDGTLNRKPIGQDQWTAAINNAVAAIRAEFEEKLETKTDYLGVVSAVDELSTIAGAGDYHRVQSDFIFGDETAHAGDLLIAVINFPAQTAECWDLIHTEEKLQADWNQNDENAKDYIKNKPNIENGEGIDSLILQVNTIDPTDVDENGNLNDFANVSTADSAVTFGKSNINNAKRTLMVGKLNIDNGSNSIVGGLQNTVKAANGFTTGSTNIVESDAIRSVVTGLKNENYGRDSVQAGTYNINKGTLTIQSGYSNENNGDGNIQSGNSNSIGTDTLYAIQSGQANENSGSGSVQVGYDNTNSGLYSIQGGSENINTAEQSMQVGNKNTNNGKGAIQLGFANQNANSFAFQSGSKNINEGVASIQGGTENENYGGYSIEVGRKNVNRGQYSALFGYNLHNEKTDADGNNVVKTVVGTSNEDKLENVFEVGNGTVKAPKNAFEVLRDGRAKVQSAPTEGDDIVRKQELDEKIQNSNLDKEFFNSLYK